MIVYKFWCVYVEVPTGYPGVDHRYAESKSDLLYRTVYNQDLKKKYIILDAKEADWNDSQNM